MIFEILTKDPKSNARRGRLITDHGSIETPIFMPVGTIGSVKAMTMQQVEEAGAEIILGNTYHLYLRPGLEILRNVGGLHRFNSWHKPILTDSGGFQVFSLSARRKISREGVSFSSHIDGSKHLFTPERVVDIQRIIGADIIMAFDECCPGDAPREYACKSLEITENWLDRCMTQYRATEPLYGYHQSLFPIVQGCVYPDLRKRAAEKIASLDAEGNAIGGLAVGEPPEAMYEMISLTNDILPETRPRYLMGVGTPENILEAIGLGVDMFDCIMPTRDGRNGRIFTRNGMINIKNSRWKNCFDPIEKGGASPIDEAYSLAYLHHLFRAEEILGLTLASMHNVAFYMWLVREARKHIELGDFALWKPETQRRLMQKV